VRNLLISMWNPDDSCPIVDVVEFAILNIKAIYSHTVETPISSGDLSIFITFQ
jgi:hypothetical protein